MVVELAHTLGWDHNHTRRARGRGGRGAGWVTPTSKRGWPDLVLWHPRQQRVLFVELKADDGKVTPEQAEVLAGLWAAGAEVGVWRPAMLDSQVLPVLQGKQRLTDAPSF